VQFYEQYTYGDLLKWAEDVQAMQQSRQPQRDEAVNIESELNAS
jgi:hypothetical protein